MSTSEEEVLEPSSSGTEASPREAGSKLFLGGLSWDTSEDKLREHFGEYGELVEVVVMRDRGTGRPRGFGFVTYKDPQVADRAVKDTHIIDGRQIDTKKSVPQESKPKARKIFVGGLAPETTEEDFKAYFGQFGKIAEVQIMQDHMSGRSRGFGFVVYEEDSSAESVFSAGTMHEMGGKRVEVKPATPKGSGPQAPPRTAAPRGRTQSAYEHQQPSGMMPYGGGMPPPGTPTYGAYGMYGYAGRPGMMPGPYGMQPQYGGMPGQYMMMQPGLPGYATPSQSYGAFPPPQMFGGPERGGQGGAAAPIPFSRPSQQRQQGYYRQAQASTSPSPTASPPYYPGQQKMPPSGRSKVDSASSLDQHAENFRHLSLE